MIGLRLIGWSVAAWLVFASANSASGQVWLEPRVIEIPDDEETVHSDDRYGDFEPVPWRNRVPGVRPILTAQREEQPLPDLHFAQTPPSLEPQPETTIPPAPQLGPPLSSPMPMPLSTPAPVIIDYGYPAPMAGPYHRCPPWRPCGPQNSFGMNWLIPQGFAGADFRPSCQMHDECLMSGCYDRKTCDRMYLASMDCACNNSMFPLLCRLEARKCYLGVRMFGWLWY